MAYTDIYTAATDPDHVLRKQVAVAMHDTAVDVINEDPETENHANRLVWARRTTQDNAGPVSMAERWIWKVLENATIQSDPTGATDNDVQFVVNSIVNLMANTGV
jgi:hypothetical protein